VLKINQQAGNSPGVERQVSDRWRRYIRHHRHSAGSHTVRDRGSSRDTDDQCRRCRPPTSLTSQVY